MLVALSNACLALPAFPAPVIAAVHGACLGGAMELISFCDFVVASPDAVLGQPEIKLAFFPPVALHRLPRLTGYQNAAYTILSGENLPADRAQSMGVVQKILAKDEWWEIDALFNGLSAPVLRITKSALAKSVSGGSSEGLEAFNAMFMSGALPARGCFRGDREFRRTTPPRMEAPLAILKLRIAGQVEILLRSKTATRRKVAMLTNHVR